VAGTSAAWQNVDVSLGAGEVVPDRKLYLPPQAENYSHDLDGNMTGDGRWAYTWDGENRLTSASTTSSAYTAGVPGRKVEYTYDWMGRMIRRVGYSGNPSTPAWTLTDDTRFAYDGWLCRWESMTNSSAASKPWVTSIVPSTTFRNDYTGWVGMRILTGESPVWVTRLGRWVHSGNSGTHTVKLVSASTGVDVSGGSVSVNTSGASTNRFLYVDLASPIQLAANTAYYLVSLETHGADRWFHHDAQVSPGSGLTVTHAAYGSGGSYWTSASSNNCYGPVSLVGVPTTESRTQLWGLDMSGTGQGAGGVGGLVGARTGTAATRLMAYDGNGNIVGIVDGGTGKTSAILAYSPFGEMIARQGESNQDRYGFSTKWGDMDTGTCYYGYRFHVPETGRWLSRDPIAELGFQTFIGFGRRTRPNDSSPYRFVANNPPVAFDPFGLFELQFDTSHKFTLDQKNKVRELIDAAGSQAKIISDELAKLIPRMKKDHSCCPELVRQLEELKRVMDRIVEGVNSSSENLEIEQLPLKGDIEMQMVVSPVPFYDPVLQMNTASGMSWEERGTTDTMLHELSHIYGTEDDDSEGELLDAATIETYTSGGVEKSSAFRGLLLKCPRSPKPKRRVPAK